MGIEVLIFSYGVVCISMIAFNCVCIVLFKNSERRLHRKSSSLNQKVAVQMKRIKEGNLVEQKHCSYLSRKLSRVGNLMAFDETITQWLQTDPQTAQKYLYELRAVFLHLSVVYLKKETMQSAYYAYILSKYKISRYCSFDSIMDILIQYLKKESLYCRQNAMRALYSFGNEQNVVDAIKVLDRENVFFHSKILSDGLLQFEGDHDKLIRLFWQSLDSFAVETQVSILNYIRFKSGDWCEQMFEILTDANLSCELHFSAIRYFGRYPYQPAYRILLEHTASPDPLRWNYAAVSASALAAYPGEQTVHTLKKALKSENWYARYNAAQSLEALGLHYDDLLDIINGNDRYAREMILYHFSRRQLSEEQKRREAAYDGRIQNVF